MNDGHADRLRRGLKVPVPPFFDGTNALHTIWKVLLKKKMAGNLFQRSRNLVYKVLLSLSS
jgi:hypothetical protein